jgi:hypothetical protein
MNIFNKPFFHLVWAFLTAISGQLSDQLQKDLTANKMELRNHTLELKKEISGGSTINLVDDNTVRLDGICSFDKNMLKNGRAFVFDKIALGYASNAAAGKEGAVVYNSAAPVELQNAILVIKQEGREVSRIPVRNINNIATGFTAENEFMELDCLEYFVDGRAIEIQLIFPPSVTLSNATHHYIYLRLKGAETRKKANS